MSVDKNSKFKLGHVSKRGQVALPKEYRKALGIFDKADVQIMLEGDVITVRPVKIFPIRHSLAKSSSLREEVLNAYKDAKEGRFISEAESEALFQTQVEANTTKR